MNSITPELFTTVFLSVILGFAIFFACNKLDTSKPFATKNYYND